MIILNERAYAEDCLRNNRMDTKPFQTLVIIANYFAHVKNYSREEMYSALVEYYSLANPKEYFQNKHFWENTIDTIVSKAGKYPLYEIDGVWITNNELATINKIEGSSLKRLAFTLICLARLNNSKNHSNNFWVNNDYKEIFTLARVNCKKRERYINIGKLYRLGLIEVAKRIDNLSIRVTFADTTKNYYSRDDGDLFVSDFRELGYEYLYAMGGNFIRCAECGILTRGNKNGTKKYCNNCSGRTIQVDKIITCVDCGKRFKVNAKNHQTCRCPDCYSVYRKMYYRENKRKNRANNQMSTAQG